MKKAHVFILLFVMFLVSGCIFDFLDADWEEASDADKESWDKAFKTNEPSNCRDIEPSAC